MHIQHTYRVYTYFEQSFYIYTMCLSCIHLFETIFLMYIQCLIAVCISLLKQKPLPAECPISDVSRLSPANGRWLLGDYIVPSAPSHTHPSNPITRSLSLRSWFI